MPAANWGRVCAGLVLSDRVLFRRHFFRDQLTLAPSLEQKLMWCDNSQRVLFCTGRKISKTIHLEAEVIQTGLLYKAVGDGVDEALLWTPNDVHMTPLIDRIFSRVERSPILAGCVREKRRGDNTIIEFRGGLRWYARIEGLSGRDTNVVGLRAHILLGDEQAFGQEVVYKSLIMSAMPTARWIMAGVPNGVRRSIFYQLDQTNLGKSWSRHKYSTYINPLYYGDEARTRLIDDYGGENTHGYKTQVLGDWGDEMFTSFPAGSIAVDDPKRYKHFSRVLDGLEKEDLDVLPLRLGVGSLRCKRFILSLDYGFSPDPSILGGFYSDDDEARIWHQFLQVRMIRVPQPYQIAVILHVMETVFRGQFLGFASDHLPTVQVLREKVRADYIELIQHASPGSSTEFDMAVVREQEPDLYRLIAESERGKEIVKIHNKQLWTEWLRSWMINANQELEATQMYLADIPETLNDLTATTEKKADRGGYIIYSGARDPDDSKRQLDHTVDMLRYAAFIIHQAIQKRDQKFSEDQLLAALGWAGGESETAWKAPWDGGTGEAPAPWATGHITGIWNG